MHRYLYIFCSDNNKKYNTYKDEFLNRQNNSTLNPELKIPVVKI